MARSQAGKARKTKRDFVINVTLPVELDRFLQQLGAEAWEQGGAKLQKTKIMRALAKVLRELRQAGKLNLKGVEGEADFEEKLREAFGLKR